MAKKRSGPASKQSSRDALDLYHQKRNAGKTTEPMGKKMPARRGSGIFVVQKHAATRLHYDFRLELDGVLVSWAVPRGPSLDPKEKRLAVHVENHPVEYADFEGIIPEGNYGAGQVIVWDRGSWEPLEDPRAGLASGNLKFRVSGYKLAGEFALVRTKKSGERTPSKEWLLIKKQDAFARDARQRPLAETSVLSGLGVEQLEKSAALEQALIKRIDKLGGKRKAVDARAIKPMLCSPSEPFSGKDWLFELKYDGYRLLGAVRAGQAQLRYRRGIDVSRTYPEILLALETLPYQDVVFDGEVVLFDATGRAQFGWLQERGMRMRPQDAQAASRKHPATFMIFDLLAFGGYDLRPLPLALRKKLLAEIIPTVGVLRYSDFIETDGEAFYESVIELGLEGMVAKRKNSPYREGRSDDWRKVRALATDDFAVIGYTLPDKASRAGFGALHVAVWEKGAWLYAGAVGGGFSDKTLAHAKKLLDGLERADYPEAEARAMGKRHVWVVPKFSVEVRYKEWLDGRLLRQPTFMRLREDKAPRECVRKQEPQSEPVADDIPEDPRDAEPESRVVGFSNLQKLFWPDEKYTKGDLIEYYRDVSPFLMPYLADRPVVLTRYPDGINGKSFYQKDAPEWVPAWVRTETVWSEHAERDIHYFVCDNPESLLYLANLGTIPLHVWSSRVQTLAQPDWCILDLDPKGAPFENVMRTAAVIHDLCEEVGLPSFVKTSGSTGLHILIPLGAQLTYEQSRSLAGLLCGLVEQEIPDIATMERTISRRQGKVYLDWLQNRHGQLLVAPLSVRPLPGATVSMPLKWSEVKKGLKQEAFTIKSARRRLDKVGDPVLPVLTTCPDLLAVLERLERRMQRSEMR